MFLLAQDQADAPRTWDELALKIERRFRVLLRLLDAMRTELEDAKRYGRQLEKSLLREDHWHG